MCIRDSNMQCVAKFRPVAIDTDDANGGIARTSFLYVEVEADQKITVEPMICPEGYVTPTKTYEIQYASSPDNYWSCPEPWSDDETITCDIPDAPLTYDDFLDNPASYSCVKVTYSSPWDTRSEMQCNIHDYAVAQDICCPADKSTLYMRQPTHEEWMGQSDWEGMSDHPQMTLGRCTAARFGAELHGGDVDLTAVPFDTSDRVSPVAAMRMDGQDGRDGPYTIKDVYKKLGDRAKKAVSYTHLTLPTILRV